MPEARKPNPNYQPSLFSIVTIKGGDVPDREFLVNFSDHNVKVWYTKTLIWGLTNGREITIARATSSEVESRQLFTPRPETVS